MTREGAPRLLGIGDSSQLKWHQHNVDTHTIKCLWWVTVHGTIVSMLRVQGVHTNLVIIQIVIMCMSI